MENKRQLLVEALKDLIPQKGYRNTTIDDITKAANIAKGSFYTYFKNKDEVLDEILMEKLERIEIQNAEILQTQGPLEEIIGRLLDRRIRSNREEIKTEIAMMYVLQNIDALSSKTRRLLVKRNDLNMKFLQDLLVKFGEVVRIALKDVVKYARVIEALIAQLEMQDVYITKRDGFIFERDPEVIVKRIQSADIEERINFCRGVIMKVLT
ncbi:MAG: TetR/AcrR family transcriptional regulator [Fusobacteriaceae bacterium]|jgi:AcrR family transcriptional regulator|nr:TetR/AcrR family transcriptional regulator [Fusobacteriaceae bacterium]